MSALEPGKHPEKKSLGCGGCLGIIVVAAIVVVALLWGCSTIGSRDRANDPDTLRYEAIAGCEALVAEQLRSPATAQFDSTASGGDSWTVRGTVDSDNAFGATVRTDFECLVTITGDRVRTVIISLDGQ